MTPEGALERRPVLEWIEERRRASSFEVRRIPFAELKDWHFEKPTGNLVHKSGRFFKIEGIDVRTNFGGTEHWMQPIINQSEVGILGFLTQEIDGVLHLLVQAKMEPGNVNLIQISPTVQATRSNYTRVHGGARTKYLDYFLDPNRARVLVDQLQSEQGSRYLRKRNRNMIVQVPSDETVPLHQDFCWVTLGQLLNLLTQDNLVNMDSRTVLSCIRYTPCSNRFRRECANLLGETFARSVLESALADPEEAWHHIDTIISWITELKTRYFLNTKSIPLNTVDGWERHDAEIRHKTGRYFSIIAVSVEASNREVGHWHQPLVESAKGGILCFLAQKKRGILHFLVQGRVEPGNFDSLELAPTVQCTPSNYDSANRGALPPFYELIEQARSDQIRFTTIQSEEGGRFYQDQNRYLIVEIDPSSDLTVPENYIWMTIQQIKELIRFNNYFNIEARGLISCLRIANPTVS